MARKTKLAKSRLDKYYNLAKEQGYRARSAYKLIQISKRYNIFRDCNTLIDLCAAPGGWLQVASDTMPINSLIIGVDLVPIKPIKNVITLQLDITSQYAKHTLLKRMNGAKADVILHDGSPNMGSNWNLDAFNQNQLVLSATNLACNLLRKGGTYVTKVFRSADYSSLIWVFQELFHIVKATKPQSSRIVSAEIFVICMRYKSPQFLDPKLFDFKHVFKNRGLNPDQKLTEDSDKSKSLSHLLKLKERNKRQGYSDGDDYREVSIIDYLKSDNPSDILVNYNRIRFIESETSDIIRNHPLTTQEILTLFSDLQVLGKKDLLLLLKWRMRLLKCIKDDKLPIPELLAKLPTIQVLPPLQNDELKELDDELDTKVSEIKNNSKKLSKSMKKKQKRFLENLKKGTQIAQNEDSELFSNTKESQLLLEHGSDIESCVDSISDHEEIENETYIPIDVENDYKCIEEELEKDYVMQKERLKIKAEKASKKATRREASYIAKIQQLTEETKRIESSGFKTWQSDDEYNSESENEELKLQFAEESQSEGEKLDVKSSTGESCIVGGDNCYKIVNSKSEEKNIYIDESGIDYQNEFNRTEFSNEIDEVQSIGIKHIDSIYASDKTDLDKSCEFTAVQSELLKNAKEGRINKSIKGLNTKNTSKTKDAKIYRDELPNDTLSVDCITNINHNVKSLHSKKDITTKTTPEETPEVERWFKQDIFNMPDDTISNDVVSFKSNVSNRNTDNNVELHPTKDNSKPNAFVVGDGNEDSKKSKLDPDKIQLLGPLLISKKSRLDLMDGMYNRYAYNEDIEDLPLWFREDEEMHTKVQLPLTKEQMRVYRMKLKEIKSLPIRKVKEAISRRMKKIQNKLDKVRTDTERISNRNDVSIVHQIEKNKKILRKVAKDAVGKKNKVYVVSNKFGNNSVRSGKKSGEVIKFVDKRMKKDNRNAKKTRKVRKTGRHKGRGG
ncbi:SPB1, FTSJ3, AdoMet-dependent rRNA methyltransferase SPB1 [Babesia microti strain RI]|uniref:Putative rRNA methyltransferase n=1 Tax=Babesia microti (strain RI) TaxID=1133968 RepID=A0A1N6LXT3_BABMR|nr:SPB1, FTSJ3, AdoMet-dependent rRNA methyltransferase SPB1 [Babesia microti strain RI]SIO73671.1 SPB1, FTSJ3, AdoMet-dependent rRNA methyltransferase SPB1 [Babesia microti strain RI]|eukprot:XP_012649924.2 SPB1, FTSJ3, AdoMet-dependent rRNA methyltransferase SPB1 [Babesia microti strain RI]